MNQLQTKALIVSRKPETIALIDVNYQIRLAVVQENEPWTLAYKFSVTSPA